MTLKYKNKNYKRLIVLLIVGSLFLLLDNPLLLFQRNTYSNVKSQSIGQINNGSLISGVRLPYKGENYKYFSKVSYYVLGRAYLNARVYNTILQSYKKCESTCPEIYFRVMECSRKHGGKAFPHRTHQNGLSVDFMIPLKKAGKQFRLYDKIGVWHYLLNTNEQGDITKKIKIDFNTLAKHLLALDDAAQKNGLKVKKVIIKINLKDNLFRTVEGKELKKRDIYFVRNLPETIDNLHDDHYHVDFEEIK